jgi:hypothetical protein
MSFTNKLTILQTLAPALSLSVLNSSIIPLLHDLSQDSIPNIRFNVAKSYTVLVDVLNQVPDTGMANPYPCRVLYDFMLRITKKSNRLSI